MPQFFFPNAVTRERADNWADNLDAAGAATFAYMVLYSGVMPVDGDAPITGVALVSIDFENPAMTAAIDANPGATVTANGLPIAAVASFAGGVPLNATHYRVFNRANEVRGQGDVTVTGGGGAATIDNISIEDAATVNLTGFTHTEPES